MERTSEISSLADSGDENGKRLSASPSTARKRKRSSFEQDSASDQDILVAHSVKFTKTFRNTSAGALVENTSAGGSAEEDDHEMVVDVVALSMDQNQLQESPEPALPQQRYRKGKREGRKIRDDELENKDNRLLSAGVPGKQEENQEAVYSDEEDCENDDTGDVPGADNAAKNEEGGKEIFKKHHNRDADLFINSTPEEICLKFIECDGEDLCNISRQVS